MQSIKNAGPDDSWQYAYFSLEDLNAEPEDHWIIFDKLWSNGCHFGMYRTEEDAREANRLYIELPEEDLEFITVAEFKVRLQKDPELDIEPGPDCIE